MFTTYVRNLL